MNKIWLVICVVVAILSFSITLPVVADSGWDSDYGGGWSSSSSDWGSSSGWGSSSDWSSSDWDSHRSSENTRSYYTGSNGYHSSSGDDIFFTVFFVVIVICVMVYLITGISQSIKNSSNNPYDLDNYKYIGDSDSEIQKFFPGLTERQLIKILYDKFVAIQNAWMNFDYDSLKKLCSDELYSSYKSDLEVLKARHCKNFMGDFNLVVANINGIREEAGLVTVSMYLHVDFFDFVINTDNNSIIKGNNTHKLHNQYILEFVVSHKGSIDRCPSCGAPIEKGAKNCEYCNTIIIDDYGYFVLNTKKRAGH